MCVASVAGDLANACIRWHRVEVAKKDHPLMIGSLLDQGDRLLHLLLADRLFVRDVHGQVRVDKPREFAAS